MSARHLLLLAVCLAVASVANGLTRTYANSQVFNPKYTFHWQIEGDEIAIGLVVQTTGWIGFGIAEQISGSMRGGDIVTASVSGGTTTIIDRYATEHAEPSHDDCQSWTLIAGSEMSGVTSVELRRKLDTGDSQDRPIPPGRVRVIWSFSADGSDTVAYHGDNKGPTVVIFYGAEDTPMVNGTDVKHIDLTNDNYLVPNASTFYACRTFALPFDSTEYIIAAEPIISAASMPYVHHFAVIWCTSNDSFVQQHYTTDNCFGPFGKIASSCTIALFGWGPHSAGQVVYLPEEVGMKMGPGSIEIIQVQVHFANYDERNDIVDSSGVRLHYTSTPRKYNAGVLTLGDPTISALPIPPGVANWDFQSECPSECTSTKFPQNITIFAGYNHAHHLAKSAFTSLWRGNTFVSYIGRAEFYDFNFQQTAMENNIMVYPGDRLISHCVYDSTDETAPTTFGIATENEMCTVMLFYYPQIEDFSFCAYSRLNKSDPIHNITYCGLRQASDIMNYSNPQHTDSSDRITPLFGQSNSLACHTTSGQSTIDAVSTTGSPASIQIVNSFVVVLMLALLCLYV